MNTSEPNPAAALARLAAALEAGTPPAADDSRAFAAGVARWLEGTDDLERALGLQGGPGRRTARTLYRLHRRDLAICAAHALMDAPGPWQRSVALAAEVARFEALIWPRWRDLTAPPAGASVLRSLLFEAARWYPLPSSVRAVHGIACPQPMGTIHCGERPIP